MTTWAQYFGGLLGRFELSQTVPDFGLGVFADRTRVQQDNVRRFEVGGCVNRCVIRQLAERLCVYCRVLCEAE